MECANDPVICCCKNTCKNSGKGRSRRGVCPCLKQNVVCTELCNCGSSKMSCANRSSEAVRVKSENLGVFLDEVRTLKRKNLVGT